MVKSIAVSVVIPTKDEAENIGACLDALHTGEYVFDDVWVLDSDSTDETQAIAWDRGAHVQGYVWDGQYPKKKQFAVGCLALKYDWVFVLDADEIVPDGLVDEIAGLAGRGFDGCAGFFVRGVYVFEGRRLKHGLKNNKLSLFDRRKIEFPVIDDLDIEGMGEIEGHYQPVLKVGFEGARIGALVHMLDHVAMEDEASWMARHKRYAIWEAGMNARGAWPRDPVAWREFLKRVFRGMPFRGVVAFLHCYIYKCGFLDGWAGFRFARLRGRYYEMIRCEMIRNKN